MKRQPKITEDSVKYISTHKLGIMIRSFEFSMWKGKHTPKRKIHLLKLWEIVYAEFEQREFAIEECQKLKRSIADYSDPNDPIVIELKKELKIREKERGYEYA